MLAHRVGKTEAGRPDPAALRGACLLVAAVALGVLSPARGAAPVDNGLSEAEYAREAASGPPRVPASAVLLVRSSPIAGFQFHAGEQVWRDLRVGEPLSLVREPANPHDANAVRVDWRGRALGYVPRRDNRQVARQLDLGMALQARVSRLRESRNPWDRVEFEVVLPLPSAAGGQSAPASSP